MPLDDPDKIDISLALIGSESVSAVNTLIQQIGDLDQRLRDMASEMPNYAAQAAQQKRISDRSRGIVPTGSTSGPPPQVMLPGGTIYNPSGVGPVSPISETSLRSRAKNALGELRYRGVPEGEEGNQESVDISKQGSRFNRIVNAALGPSVYHGRGQSNRLGYPWEVSQGMGDYGNYGGSYGGGPGNVSAGASLPPGMDPSSLPNWARSADIQRAYSPVEMPYEGWGALSKQKQLEMAADWLTRRGIGSASQTAQQAGTGAYQSAYDQAYQSGINEAQTQAMNRATQAAGGPITDDQYWNAMGEGQQVAEAQAQQAAQQAAQNASNTAYAKTLANSTSGAWAGAFNRVAQQIPNVSAATNTALGAGAFFSNLIGGGDSANVSFIDPNLLNPAYYVRHPFGGQGRTLQAIGQQMGLQAGNENVPGGLEVLRAWQNPLLLAQDPAVRGAANLLLESRLTAKDFSRVTTEQAGQFQMGLGSFGYSGAQSNAILASGAGVMQNSGIDPALLSQIYGQNLQYGGGNLSEVSDALHDLGASAKNAHQNLDEYAQGLLDYGTEALKNGAISVAQGMLQGRTITSAFPGLNPQDAAGLANNPFVQTMTMMNTGLLPFQQGGLPGSAITQSTQQAMGFYMNAASAFARPTTTKTPFGSITTSAHQAQVQAAAGMMGISVPEAEALMRNPQKSSLVSGAQSIIGAYLDPATGKTNVDPSTFLNQINKQGLLQNGQYRKLLSTLKSDPRTMMRQLQNDLNVDAGNQENNTNQGLPAANVQISLADEAKQLLGFGRGGKKKSTSVIARAGGPSTAQQLVNPSVSNWWKYFEK